MHIIKAFQIQTLSVQEKKKPQACVHDLNRMMVITVIHWKSPVSLLTQLNLSHEKLICFCMLKGSKDSARLMPQGYKIGNRIC